MRPYNPRLVRAGFSLMELMVVVSIIALLVSISLPSLGKARTKTAQVVCLTKIRGLGTALQVYLSDWGGKVPVNGLILPKSGVPDMYANSTMFKNAEVTNPNKWRLEFGALWNYMGGAPTDFSAALPIPAPTENMAKRYVCQTDYPGLDRTFQGGQNTNGTAQFGNSPLTLPILGPGTNPVVLQGPGAPGYWSYTVNSVFNSLGRFRNRFQDASGNGVPLPWMDPLRIIDVKTPQELITFIEEDNASIFNDEVFDAPAYSQGDMITGRHYGGGNVGFADGHAEYFNQVIFDQVPSGISGSYVSHNDAMTSPITRMFFPDRGAFVH